jgi:hypothetical protein
VVILELIRATIPTNVEGRHLLDKEPTHACGELVIHDN